MALAFLSKKTFHTSRPDNVQRVFDAERAVMEEKRKLAELQKTLKAEREREQLDRQHAAATGKKRAPKLDWMYQGAAAAGPSQDDFLLGRAKVGDAPPPEPLPEQTVPSAPEPAALPAPAEPADGGVSMRVEDPMFAVMTTETQQRAAALADPIAMRNLRERLLQQRLREREAEERRSSHHHHRHRRRRRHDEEEDEHVATERDSGRSSSHRHRHERRGRRRRHHDSDSDDDASDINDESSSSTRHHRRHKRSHRRRHHRRDSDDDGDERREDSDGAEHGGKRAKHTNHHSHDASRDRDVAAATSSSQWQRHRRYAAEGDAEGQERGSRDDETTRPPTASSASSYAAAESRPPPSRRAGYGLQMMRNARPAAAPLGPSRPRQSLGPPPSMVASRTATLDRMRETNAEEPAAGRGQLLPAAAAGDDGLPSAASLEAMRADGEALTTARRARAAATLRRTREEDARDRLALLRNATQ